MENETFIIGTAEAIEAEYGYTVEGFAYIAIQFYNGEYCGIIPFYSKDEAKEELAWCESGQVEWLV